VPAAHHPLARPPARPPATRRRYAPLVYGVLLTYLQPDALCGELGYCQPPSAAAALSQPLLTAGLAQSRAGSRVAQQLKVT
jgi:hypothetical protein